jgi:hypothetical protein
VNDGHVAGFENMLYGVGLAGVEPRAADSRKLTGLRLKGTNEGFAESHKILIITAQRFLQSAFHHLIRSGVNAQTKTKQVSTTAIEDRLNGVLPNDTETQRARCHAVDIALMRKFVYRTIVFLIEKTDGLSRFELIVAEVVGHRATDSEYQVVKGVAMPLDRLNGESSTRNEGILNFEF